MPNDAPELIPRLQYTKNWENPADYATRQNNEVQNRKDIQSLFTEIATYLNNVMLPRAEQLISEGGGGSGTGSGGGSGVSGDYLPLDGGTMRGILRLFRNPELDAEAATKRYVDQGDSAVRTDMEGNITAIRQRADEIELLAQNNAGDIASLKVRADEITSRVADAEGDISEIRQTAESITSRVENAVTENGEVFARLTLRIGPNELYGYIKLEGNVNVSGQLSADAIYAGYGEVGHLAVDQLTTSRRIVRYLAGDTGDDNYIKIYGQNMLWITGSPTGGTEQAKTPDGAPLYWPLDVSGLSRGTDGYPVTGQGERIFTTATPTAYPVQVYSYSEAVKRSVSFEAVNGIYSPIDRFGAGNQQGKNRAWILKTADGFDIRYLTPDNREIGIRMTTEGKVLIDGLALEAETVKAALGAAGAGFDLAQINGDGSLSGLVVGADGYADIRGLRKPVTIDFSRVQSGAFSETLDGGILNRYSVERDESGRIRTITDTEGHVTTVLWG